MIHKLAVVVVVVVRVGVALVVVLLLVLAAIVLQQLKLGLIRQVQQRLGRFTCATPAILSIPNRAEPRQASACDCTGARSFQRTALGHALQGRELRQECLRDRCAL